MGDVMLHLDQGMPVVGHADQQPAHHREPRRIDPLTERVVDDPLERRLDVRLGAQVDHRELHVERCVHTQHPSSVFVGKRGPQYFVPGDQAAERALEKGDVELSVEPEHRLRLVRQRRLRQLAQEQRLGLGDGRWCDLVLGRAFERWECPGAGRFGRGPFQPARQRAQRPLLENGLDRQVATGLAADAAEQRKSEQRVAACFEEVVVGARITDAQHVLPRGRDDPFGGRQRGHGPRHRRPHGCRKSGPVHLPDHGQGQLLEEHKGGRDHVLGKPPQREPPQLRRDDIARSGRVRHQTLVAGDVLAGDDHNLVEARMGVEGRLHLGGLDAEASDLDLVVGSAEEFECTVGVQTDQVATAVQATAVNRAGGIVDEFLFRELGPIEIAAGHPVATDVELSTSPAATRCPSASST